MGGVLSRGIERWLRLEEEAREIRRKQADWKFIDSQPPRLRAALRLYVEMGDIRLASKVAGMGVEEFRELLRRARVPVVV
jgi:predicted HTH domain antitoxin